MSCRLTFTAAVKVASGKITAARFLITYLSGGKGSLL